MDELGSCVTVLPRIPENTWEQLLYFSLLQQNGSPQNTHWLLSFPFLIPNPKKYTALIVLSCFKPEEYIFYGSVRLVTISFSVRNTDGWISCVLYLTGCKSLIISMFFYFWTTVHWFDVVKGWVIWQAVTSPGQPTFLPVIRFRD